MPLISLVLVLAVVGFICWLILQYVPMPAPFKSVIIVVIVIVMVLYLLQVFGVVGPTVPRLR